MGELTGGCVTDVTGTRNPGAAGDAPVPRDGLGAHRAAVALLRSAYAAIPPGSPVRLAKRTSNLFRFSGGRPPAGLDVSAFGRVRRVAPAAPTAVRGGLTHSQEPAHPPPPRAPHPRGSPGAPEYH